MRTPTRRIADNDSNPISGFERVAIDPALSSSSNQRLAAGTLSPLVMPYPGGMQSLVDRSEPKSPVSTVIRPLSHFHSRELLQFHDHVLSQQEQDRRDRLHAWECEQERRQALKRKEEKAQLEKEVEFIMRWDDFSAPFGKIKEKGKDNRIDHSSHKEREKKSWDRLKASENSSAVPPSRYNFDQDKEKKDRDRGREREWDDQKEKERGNKKNDEPSRSGDRSYVPSSREEAMAAGMRIVCALFKTVGRAEALEKASAAAGKPFTKTGPSLSLFGSSNECKADEGVDEVERESQWKFETEIFGAKSQSIPLSDSSGNAILASRKSSLPGLGLGLGLLSTGGSGSSSGTSRLGGLFGTKDKDKESNAKKSERKKEKEGRFMSDKDRKATGKDGDHDEDDNQGFISSGRSFKLGKKKKDNTSHKPEPSSVEKDWTSEAHPKVSHVDRKEESGARKPTLSVTTGDQVDAVGESYQHSSPIFAHNVNSDEDLPVQEHRQGYRHGRYEEKVNPLKSAEQQSTKSSDVRKTKKEVDKDEWIILDMGTDVGKSSPSFVPLVADLAS